MYFLEKQTVANAYFQDEYLVSISQILGFLIMNRIEHTDIGLSFGDYLSMLQNFTTIPEGYIDDEGRPTFQVGGIRFHALKKEEADKYRVLK